LIIILIGEAAARLTAFLQQHACDGGCYTAVKCKGQKQKTGVWKRTELHDNRLSERHEKQLNADAVTDLTNKRKQPVLMQSANGMQLSLMYR